MAAQAGLCLTWSKNAEDRFFRDEAHINDIVLSEALFFCQVNGNGSEGLLAKAFEQSLTNTQNNRLQ